MSMLNRNLAPISPAAWSEIDAEVRETLKVLLAGRKFVDFNGPVGWQLSAVSNGHVREVDHEYGENLQIRKRAVQPLIELRREFQLSRADIDAIDRGAGHVNLEAATKAAQDIAFTEDNIVFNGMPDADISGIIPSAVNEMLTISEDYENYPVVVAQALTALRKSGVAGPYGIILGPRCYTGLHETTVNGFPVMKHVAALLDGPVISAPAVNGAIVLSCRGGDYEFTSGRDLAIGYLDHDSRMVHLYIEESFTFRIFGDDAAVPLGYAGSGKTKSRHKRT